MLSQLSQGVGTWTGEIYPAESIETAQASLPFLEEETHRHGVTISAQGRAGATHRTQSLDPDVLKVSKTFLTRRGALLIFTAPDDFGRPKQQIPIVARLLRRKRQNSDPSSSFGTIDRFTKSVLMFGDEDYEKETTSISDQGNAIFLKFLHSLDSEKLQDLKLQPGGDFNDYLSDVKSRATSAGLSSDSNSGKRKITADAESLLDAFTRPVSQTSHKRSSRPCSANSQKKYRVLSAEKLRASLHSASSYLGRPSSALISTKEEDEDGGSTRQGSGRSRHAHTRGSLSSYDAHSPISPPLSYRSNKKYYTLFDNVKGAQGDAILIPSPMEEGDKTKSDGEAGKGKVSKSLPAHGSIHSLHETASTRRQSRVSQQSAHSDSMLHARTSPDNMVTGDNMLHGGSSHGNILTRSNLLLSGATQDNKEWMASAASYACSIPMDLDGSGGLSGQMAFDDDARSVSSSLLQEEDIIMVADDIVLEDMYEALEADDEVKSTQDGMDGETQDEEALQRKLQSTSGQDGVKAPASSPSDIPDQLSSRTRSANSGAFDADIEDECDSNFAGPLQPQYKMASLLGSMESTFTFGELMPGEDSDIRVDSETAAQVIPHRDSVHSSRTSRTSGHTSRTSGRRRQHSAGHDSSQLLINMNEKNIQDTESDHDSGPRKTSSRRSSRHRRSVPSSISSVSKHEQETNYEKKGPDSGREEARSRMSTHSVHSKRSRSGSRRSSRASLRSRSRTPTDREGAPDMDSRPPTPPTEVQVHHHQAAIMDTGKEEHGEGSFGHDVNHKQETGVTEDVASTVKAQPSPDAIPTSPVNSPMYEVATTVSEARDKHDNGSSKPDTGTQSSRGRSSVISRSSTDMVETQAAADSKSVVSHASDQLEREEIPHVEEEDVVNKPTLPEPKEPISPVPSIRPKADKPAKVNEKTKSYVKAMDIAAMETPPEKTPHTTAQPVIKAKTQSSPKKEKLSAKHKTPKIPEQKLTATDAKSPHQDTDDLQRELEQLLGGSPKPKPQPDGALKAKAKAQAEEKRRREQEEKRKKEEEALKKIEKEVTSILEPSESSRQAKEEGGGLTVEEMELEAQILQEKMEQAEEKIKGTEQKKKVKRERDKGKKSKKAKEPKKDLAKEREALKEARRLEKEKRLEEARALEEKIKQKDEEKRLAEQVSLRKQRELEEEMEAIREEEEQARLAEEEAQAALVANRKAMREERESRRKAEAERKKAEVQRRREEERKMQERAREKEREMLSRIADAEQRRILEEQERIRREEEELLELERQEEEERRARLEAEEREEMERELERQIEEEAMARIVREREEAEERRKKVEVERRKLQEEEDRKREQMLAEKRKLEALLEQQAEEERRRQEEERQRLMQLQQMEEEARQRMRQELEKRREAALHRRDVNLERKSNLDGIKRGQGITKPWVFSYYIKWPRETYQRPMGEDPKDKKRGFRPTAKPKPKPAEGATVQVAAT